jgi:hypothetical protein
LAALGYVFAILIRIHCVSISARPREMLWLWGASEPVGSRYYLGWPAELHADHFYHQNLQKGQLDQGTV